MHGQVVLSGDVAAGTGQLEIQSDLEFLITADGNASLIVFQGWADTWDATNTSANISQSSIAYKIYANPQSTTVSHLLDNNSYWASQSVDVQQEDTYIYLSSGGFSVVDGWTIYIDAQTFDLDATTNFNSNVAGSFSGYVYLADANGNRLSGFETLGAVPEPSTYAAIMGAAVLALGVWRHRTRAA